MPHQHPPTLPADELHDDEPRLSPPGRPTLERMAEAVLDRRAALKTMSVAVASAIACRTAGADDRGKAGTSGSTLAFPEVPHTYTETHHAPEGYSADVLVRWGDKVLADAPPFDVQNQTAAAQSRQFGYNNDFVAYLPLPLGSDNSRHGLLSVNHEYTIPHLMHPRGIDRSRLDEFTQQEVDLEMAAHGHAVVEIEQVDGRWRVVEGGKYNRRITALDTEMTISGPAAGHDRMKTAADRSGRLVIGMINNCAGGVTPWGTVLSGEENFHGYFSGEPVGAEVPNQRRYGVGGSPQYAWWRYHDRFDLEKEPNEPNRFGWVVEFDPYDPTSRPVKRTALGRTRHEGAATALAADGRVVVYLGDDGKGEYLYKFVSRGRFNAEERAANRDLLDEGTLFVARFDEDGTLEWLPLTHDHGPLKAENSFHSQADVLIETRRAADLLGATPMDRPEDVEANPATGRVYVMLTNNTSRKPDETNAANPRPNNRHGHIVELIPPTAAGRVDHGAHKFEWDLFLMAGDPQETKEQARYHQDVTTHGWLSCPDNCAFDTEGRIWIATDGAPGASGMADGVYACDTIGPGRALTRCFFQAPRGAEICGPAFTPDDTTLFVAVQHPGEEGGSTFARPSTRWPDFDDKMPPRPAIVAITRNDGKVIGT